MRRCWYASERRRNPGKSTQRHRCSQVVRGSCCSVRNKHLLALKYLAFDALKQMFFSLLYPALSFVFIANEVDNSNRLMCFFVSRGAVRAFNGLGYIYFYGQGLEKNSSRAFQYFLQAAEVASCMNMDQMASPLNCIMYLL